MLDKLEEKLGDACGPVLTMTIIIIGLALIFFAASKLPKSIIEYKLPKSNIEIYKCVDGIVWRHVENSEYDTSRGELCRINQ